MVAVDAIIAGGGVTGQLAALDLQRLNPKGRILLLEQSSSLGGRLSGGGFSLLGPELCQRIHKTLGDKSSLIPMEVLREVSCWHGGKLYRLTHNLDLFSKDFLESWGGKSTGQTFERFWKKDEENFEIYFEEKKSPLWKYMEGLSMAFGIEKLERTSQPCFQERVAFWKDQRVFWPDALKAVENLCHELVEVRLSSPISGASFQGDLWHLNMGPDKVLGKFLVIAMSPWEAASWLPRDLWPTNILNLAWKTKPITMVSLTDFQEFSGEIQRIFLPSQGVQWIITREKSTGQILVPYETSSQTQTVTKAVRSLKRVKKHLIQKDILKSSRLETLSLHPTAWAQSPHREDLRWISSSFASKREYPLVFCGDAYGSSYNPEMNQMTSLDQAIHAFGEQKPYEIS